MGKWIEELGDEHEGYLAAVLDDGTDTSTWTTEIEQRTIGHRPACACGWRATISRDGPQGPELDSEYDAAMKVWHTDHIDPMLWRINVQQALEDVRDAESRLVRTVAAARTEGGPWSEIGEVLGVTKQAAHERFARAVGESS